VAIVGFLLRIIHLRAQTPHGFGRTEWIYWPTQICMAAAAALAFTNIFVQYALGAAPSPSAILGYFGTGMAWVRRDLEEQVLILSIRFDVYKCICHR